MKYVFCFLLALVFSTTLEAKNVGLVDSIPLFRGVSEIINAPEKVLQLSLKKKKLKEIPTEVWACVNLQYLDLSKNKLKELPIRIKELKKLKVLKLSKNDFDSFPSVLYELNNLQILVISDNEIAYISPAIKEMKSLIHLDFYRNNIYEIPEEMATLSQLEVLDLRGISLNYERQAAIKELLQGVKVYFSAPCNCNF